MKRTMTCLLLCVLLAGCRGDGVDALDWQSGHVAQTLELTLVKGELPPGLAAYYPDVVEPLGYACAERDVNGDGEMDYFVRVWPGMGGMMMLPDVELFLSGDGGCRRIRVGLPGDACVRLLDSETNGLPDILYGVLGNRLTFDGGADYVPTGDEMESMLTVSSVERRGRELWVPLYLKSEWPQGHYAAVYFGSSSELLERPAAWVTARAGGTRLTGPAEEYGVYLMLKPDAQAPEVLYPDELQFIEKG